MLVVCILRSSKAQKYADVQIGYKTNETKSQFECGWVLGRGRALALSSSLSA
eukprot:COSAG04_NODE_32810_length_195_cov_19.406250_1_plen_51_part_10